MGAKLRLSGRHFDAVILALFSIAFSQCNGLTAVQIKDGHYTGLVVAISPTVPEVNRDLVIDGIKKMFTAANDYLFVASKKMVTFSEVTILVPSTWTGSSYEVATHQTWNDADVRVGDQNPQYGNQPYTLQPGVCGEQGSYIYFTPHFFINSNDSTNKYGNHGRVLVHEWAHYRYGVFDEYGHPGDPFYPAVYSDGDQLRPTACTDVPLVGQFSSECSSESINSPQCKFRPDVNQNNGVNSSIMSMHFLNNVSHFCDSNTHNPLAPTKQNAFCGRRSVWQVMRTHQDFSRKVPTAYGPVTFRVVKPADGRYVLLLDCSSDMNDFVNKSSSTMQRMSFVRSAAVKFIEDVLPDGTWLSLISFGAQAEVLKPLTQLSSATRKGFTNTVPRVTCNSPERNVVAAIRLALNELNQRVHSRTDGTIITVTNGITDDAKAYPQLTVDLQSHNVRAINIIYPPMPEVTALPSLADATAGRNYIISEVAAGQRGNSSTLAQLSGALEDAVVSQSGNPLKDRLIIYEKIHPATGGEISGQFAVDSSVGRQLKVTISYYNRENIFSVLLRSPKRSYGVDHYDEYPNKNSIVFSIRDDEAMTGLWDYNLRSQPDYQPITVTVTSQPRQGAAPITLHCWTNVGNKGINASETPLIIHAALFKGGQPIVNAKVRAVIERPKVNSSHSSVELDLVDNGSGVPDSTKNDGVYSRYFTQYVDPVEKFGFYAVSVWADDNDGRARLVGGDYRWSSPASGVMPKDSDSPYCCGSDASIKFSETSGQFQRFATISSVLVTSAPRSGVDMFPPGTITDLKVKDVDPISGYVHLTWTAPGDDYDTGIVSGYELRYMHEYAALMTNLDWAPLVPDYITPMAPGSQQEFRFLCPDGRDRFYYFVLQAVDKVGHKSQLSNVVWTYVPPEPTTTTEATTVTEAPGSSVYPTEPSTVARPLLTGELVGIIVGCTLAFLLIVAIIVALLCASRRRRKLEESKMTHHTVVTPVHSPDLVKPPLGPPSTDSEKGDYVNGSTNGSAKGVYFTPASSLSPRQFIPASELLQHHEKHREMPYVHVGTGLNNHHHHHYYDEDVDSVIKSPYVSQYAPMEVVVDRASIGSSKPSSYGSQQTTEVTSSTGYGNHLRADPHSGYINTSYEDGSENSGETARLRPESSAAYAPLVSSGPRRVMSESQV